MSPEQFLQIAAKHNLAHIGRELLSTSIPAVRVLEGGTRNSRGDHKTFLGGEPIPTPADWPSCKDTPLTFVAQVTTKSLPQDICPVAVPDGVLQFFVPTTSEASDFEPSLETGRVMFIPSDAAEVAGGERESLEEQLVEPSTLPVRQGFITRLFGLRGAHTRRDKKRGAASEKPDFPKLCFEWEQFPSLYESAPDQDSIWLPEGAIEFNFDHDRDWDNYFDFRREVMACPKCDWLAQMFGFANELQEDMQPLVDVASGRRSVNEFSERLLLFSLNGSRGGLAPEAANYYFWIHRDDLAEGYFDEVWLCVQYD